MKIIFGAIALVIAAPIAAQSTDPQAGHAQHQGMDHSQHKQAKQDCKLAKQKDGKTVCEKKAEAKKTAPASGHEGHGGHAH
jgi:Ni/Co efflux regulator RcnB